jgi:hypothetical protein
VNGASVSVTEVPGLPPAPVLVVLLLVVVPLLVATVLLAVLPAAPLPPPPVALTDPSQAAVARSRHAERIASCFMVVLPGFPDATPGWTG